MGELPNKVDIRTLSLDELYDLESKNFPLAGCRTSVFLEPEERAGGRNRATLVLRSRGKGKSASVKKVTFSLKAPHARTVSLAGDFTGWSEQGISMRKDASGVWKQTVLLPPGKHQYLFIVDGQWVADSEAKPHQKKARRQARFVPSKQAKAAR